MLTIGLIREGKVPPDNRVALTPKQCKWVQENFSIKIIAQYAPNRCFSDSEYLAEGIEMKDSLEDCDIIFGIKEIPVEMLLEGKTYFFFSHTKKLQPYNQHLFQEIIRKKITLVDYECLEHEDGTRLLGFGFFAGVVGAHNGMREYGIRTGTLKLDRVYQHKNFQDLIHTYFGLKIPPVKIAVTGSGRVAHGITEIMNLMEIHEVEPEEYLSVKQFAYPVYVHLKGAHLYADDKGNYDRLDFHGNPQNYHCLFKNYIPETDILMNGVYWDKNIPALFSMEDMQLPEFRITTIADITDDAHGSVPCNLGDGTIENPVYGVDKFSGAMTDPYLNGSVDIMAVGNLPNELPRDASTFFGEQLIKYIIGDLEKGSKIIKEATLTEKGEITPHFEYMKEYAATK